MSLQKLHALVQQFNQHEQTLIRYALKAAREEGEENKYIRLYEYVIKEKKISRKAASVFVYNAMPDTRITKLAERLEEKILDVIISESFLKKSNRIAADSMMALQVQKKLIQSNILLKISGSSVYYNKFLDNTTELAEANNITYFLAEIYRLKMSAAVFIKNNKEYLFCRDQYFYYKKCIYYEEKVILYYYEIIREYGFGQNMGRGKKAEQFSKLIKEIELNKRYLHSPFSKYIFGQIKTEYLFSLGKYSLAKRHIKHLLRQLNKTIMAGTIRLKMLEVELGGCALLQGKYEEAIQYEEKQVEAMRQKNKMNFYISLEGLFFPVFYNKQYEYASGLLLKIQSPDNPVQNKFRLAKPQFFQACIHFQKKEFREALRILNKRSPLNNDKNGYDIAIRVLRILSLLELEKEELAENQVENLRKHISRNYKKEFTTERDRLIVRVLQQMARRGFMGKPYKSETELIQKLSQTKGNVKWMPKTPELIRFHEWYADWVGRK